MNLATRESGAMIKIRSATIVHTPVPALHNMDKSDGN
jgi:hypothetical protein